MKRITTSHLHRRISNNTDLFVQPGRFAGSLEKSFKI